MSNIINAFIVGAAFIIIFFAVGLLYTRTKKISSSTNLLKPVPIILVTLGIIVLILSILYYNEVQGQIRSKGETATKNNAVTSLTDSLLKTVTIDSILIEIGNLEKRIETLSDKILLLKHEVIKKKSTSIQINDSAAKEIVIKIDTLNKSESRKRPEKSNISISTEDEDIPEDETIETTDINLDELPPPPPPPIQDENDDEYVFVPYDDPPEPIGGFGAIQANLKYPPIARKAGIEGRVIVQVQIDEKGNVSRTKIAKSVGNNECDEAAINAIRKVRWKPASQRGKPAKVWISIPVVFQLK